MNDAPIEAPTRAERRSERLNDPRFDWARSRPARRRLVVVMCGLILLEGVALALPTVLRGPVTAVLQLGALVLLVGTFVLCLGVLKASTRGVEELAQDQLDERQMQVRGVVFATSYRIGSVLLMLLLGATGLWGLIVGAAPPGPLSTAVLVVTFHVSIVLPTLVGAWHPRV